MFGILYANLIFSSVQYYQRYTWKFREVKYFAWSSSTHQHQGQISKLGLCDSKSMFFNHGARMPLPEIKMKIISVSFRVYVIISQINKCIVKTINLILQSLRNLSYLNSHAFNWLERLPSGTEDLKSRKHTNHD